MEPSSDPSQKRGVPRLISKLQTNLEQGNYYEAHQVYKTLCHRYSSQKKYEEAIDILHTGSCRLLELEQYESGSDLAMMLLDVLNKLGQQEKQSHLYRLSKIHTLIPSLDPQRQLFVSKALSSTKTSTDTAGSPELHKAFAHNLWEEKLHHQAMYHFLYASDGENCGKFLVEFHNQFGGEPFEVDLFIAQTVLQLLCLKNIPTANITFTTYVNCHPDVEKGPPFLLPLLNFLWFLLLAIKDGKVTVFTVLCEKYQPSLDRDPTYKEYLDRIGQNYFGVPAPHQSGGILGGIMRNLFAGFNDDSSDDEQDGHQSIFPSSFQATQPSRPFASSDLD